MTLCAICLSRDGFNCIETGAPDCDAQRFECEVCGNFLVSRTAIIDVLNPENSHLDLPLRAFLSHRTRLNYNTLTNSDNLDLISTHTIDELIKADSSLPSPSQQITNAVRFIGEQTNRDFQMLKRLPPEFHSTIGSPTRRYAKKLVVELVNRGLLEGIDASTLSSPNELVDMELTLAGWDFFENEKKGQISSNYGFIALKFGDDKLDKFLDDHVKPALSEVGFRSVDLRDVSRAGVIDNIMRAQIRDSRFVIADLTHDNSGAYWEAGYAEGLGKPVIYICEASKFDQHQTHFDTNHCTTIMWEDSKPNDFVQELVATLQRSIS